MSDIKLFRLGQDQVSELEGRSVGLEKSLQTLLERHLESFLGVRFLATEYNTGKKHSGRIDTLGIDENRCPVIIEYKRSLNENVINQGLFYLDWLLDHKGEFQLLVMNKLGKQESEAIEWGSTRLICIAGDFTRYDEHAVAQINRNIELVRYRKYGDEFLLLELVNAVEATGGGTIADTNNGAKPKAAGKPKAGQKYKSASELLADSPNELQDRYEALRAYLLALGDDVQEKTLKFYFAYKRLKNFAWVEVHPQNKTILVYVKVDPASLEMKGYPKGFLRDVRNIGHFGTGDLEIRIRSDDDQEKAKPLIIQSYEAS